MTATMEAPSAVPQIPERSRAQRMAALETANVTRTYRSRVKQELKDGARDARELLLNPPERMHTMKVFDLLLAMPKVGRVKANRVLLACSVSPSKTLGGLTERQREALTRRLPMLPVAVS